MTDPAYLDEILKELNRDKKSRPNYPDHIAGQVGYMASMAGKTMEAALAYKYARLTDVEKLEANKLIRERAIRTAAAAIRLLENI